MIYEIQRNKQIKFKKHSFNNEKEDSPNVYSRGKYAVGLYQIDQRQDFIRKQVEAIQQAEGLSLDFLFYEWTDQHMITISILINVEQCP
ncbi:unnamed protein product [Paramecium primaurelia]|uniref:Uncharacterized protein n=1 Tax=Paramecium primaurelia TaxID=5886 RepID=A0A8S1KBW0_PARPR|nr:unnamed protein product [Paramecium primaurelia]